jgi:hypothetical protein
MTKFAGFAGSPRPIIAIHILALIGVLFWLSTIIQAFIAGSENAIAILLIGITLGGAHIAISRFTTLHNRKAIGAMWFVLVSDSLLTIFADRMAIVLVLFTVVLLLLTLTPSAKAWFQKA